MGQGQHASKETCEEDGWEEAAGEAQGAPEGAARPQEAARREEGETRPPGEARARGPRASPCAGSDAPASSGSSVHDDVDT